jgi:hypothetical protein
MNYKVKLQQSETIKIDVNTSPVSVKTLYDVDSSNRQNNYVLIWNEVTKKHEYVHPSEILDRADGVDNDSLDYGLY